MMNFPLFRSNFDYGGISPTSGMSLIFKSYLSLCRWSKQYWKKSYAKRSYFNYLIYLCFHDVVQRVQLTTYFQDLTWNSFVLTYSLYVQHTA